MTELSNTVIAFLQSYHIPSELIIFLISMLPLLELRLGLVAAAFLQVPLLPAFIICFLGNIVPIPFILLFIKAIFAFMKKHRIFPGVVNWLETKAMKKSASVQQKQYIGLLLFVGVPLPGTGGWTGALIASLLNLPIKKSFLTVAAGVLMAGVIMVIITYFLPGLFGF